jgi:hypothetical protein
MNNSLKKIGVLGPSILLGMFVLPAYAQLENYQSTLALTYEDLKYGNRTDGLNAMATTSVGTYYFSPVKIDYGQPFDEQAFLQKVNSFHIDYASMNANQDRIQNYQGQMMRVGTRLHSGGLVSELLFSNYVVSANSTNYTPVRNISTNNEIQKISVGYFVGPNASVSLVREGVLKTTTTNYSYTGSYYEALKTTSVEFHGVIPLSKSSSLVLDGSVGKSDYSSDANRTNQQQGFGFKFYPLNTIYFGFSFKKDAGEDKSSEGTTTSLTSGFMVSSRLNFQIGATRRIRDGDSINNYQINTVAAEYRL